jgi:hypothetical protein
MPSHAASAIAIDAIDAIDASIAIDYASSHPT